jgi:hypothetical protein
MLEPALTNTFRLSTVIYHTTINNGTHVMQLSRTCSDGSGKVTILGGLPAGTVYNAVFTATPSSSN